MLGRGLVCIDCLAACLPVAGKKWDDTGYWLPCHPMGWDRIKALDSLTPLVWYGISMGCPMA